MRFGRQGILHLWKGLGGQCEYGQLFRNFLWYWKLSLLIAAWNSYVDIKGKYINPCMAQWENVWDSGLNIKAGTIGFMSDKVYQIPICRIISRGQSGRREPRAMAGLPGIAGHNRINVLAKGLETSIKLSIFPIFSIPLLNRLKDKSEFFAQRISSMSSVKQWQKKQWKQWFLRALIRWLLKNGQFPRSKIKQISLWRLYILPCVAGKISEESQESSCPLIQCFSASYMSSG